MFFRSHPITPKHVSGVVACVFLFAVAVLAAFGVRGGAEPGSAQPAATATAGAGISDMVAAGHATVRALLTGVLTLFDACRRPLEVTLKWMQSQGFDVALQQKTPPGVVRRGPPAVHRLPGTNPPQS